VIIRGALNLDQVRHLSDLGDAPEAFADPLLAGECYRHRSPSLCADRSLPPGVEAIEAASRNYDAKAGRATGLAPRLGTLEFRRGATGRRHAVK
jgi:hypothetical protein